MILIIFSNTSEAQKKQSQKFSKIFNVLYFNFDNSNKSYYNYKLQFFDGTQTVTISAPESNISNAFGHPKKENLLFYKEAIGAEGEITQTPLVSCKIPSAKEFISVIAQLPNKEYKSLAIPTSKNVFPENTIQIINLTNSELGAKIGNIKKKIKPKGKSSFPGSVSGQVMIDMLIAEISDNNKGSILFQETQPARRSARKMFIAYRKNFSSGKISLATFQLPNNPHPTNVSETHTDEEIDTSDFGGYGGFDAEQEFDTE